jgi:hypothetical protein|tara:strand:+ start:306 stop:1343 length:1038 start_codon:yes stop_codon:yes gene_type:complete
MMERIMLGTIATPSCPVADYMSRFLDSGDAPDIDIDTINVENFEIALEKLQNGDLDLVALPAYLLHGKLLAMKSADCDVLGARTPRQPNPVLVSENKINYQPKSAIILAESGITRHQLRRSRKGLRVLSLEAFARISELGEVPEGEAERVAWMEALRESGTIDGYIIPRPIYSALNLNERRHALLPDPHKRGDSHFLPPAYSDLVIIIGRRLFPYSTMEKISEVEGESIWHVQNHFVGSLSIEDVDDVGIMVRHRHIAAIMKQAEVEKDLTMEQAFHNTEGEVTEGNVLVEIRIESLSSDGSRTIAMNRVTPHADLPHSTISAGKDWGVLLRNAVISDIDFLKQQ